MNLEWIPIKKRPLTEEERKHFEEHVPDFLDLLKSNYYEDTIYDCELPEDGDDVLVTTAWGAVSVDTFCNDCDGAYFEKFDEDIIAWMKLPEPYKGKNNGN